MKVYNYEFDFERVNERLEGLGAKKVLVQLPDGLKRKADVFLSKVDSKEVELWGGSCYGACDLPQDIGKNDALLHVGHSSIPNLEVSYPVIYLEGRSTCEMKIPEKLIDDLSDGRTALYSTVQYLDQMNELKNRLEDVGSDVVISEGDDRIKYPGQVLGCNFSSSCRNADIHLYIGTGKFHPIGLSVSLAKDVKILNPITGEYSDTKSDNDKMLRRRAATMALGQEADRISILLSTKIGQRREEMARNLKSGCDKCFIVSMDEITPDLVDSLNWGCAVNTACPRIALDDSIRFKTPIISPIEFKIIKNELTWCEWTMDEIS